MVLENSKNKHSVLGLQKGPENFDVNKVCFATEPDVRNKHKESRKNSKRMCGKCGVTETKWKSKTRDTSYQLRLQIYELRVQINELRVQIHELRAQIYEFRVQIYELRVQIYK